uniref:Uncharacterized protein LOC114331863 n=1 Tax=Diabrotica virgifera virgifera TaxID=50390 RepID=A0A6P7FXR2_DIAVI
MVNNNNFFNIKYDKAFDVYYRFLCTFWNILPQDTEEDLKRYKYLLPLSVFCKMATLIFFAGGTIFHLYIVKRDKIDVATSEDLSIIFSMIGILSVDLCFPFCSKGWTKIIQLLTDFSEFGKPPKIDELTVLGNKRAIGIIIFYFMCAVFYELVSILQAPGCYKDAEKKGLEVNCLTMFPLWLPFDISKMTQLIISLIQYVLLAITTMP